MRQSAMLEWVVILRGVAALWVFAYHLWLAMGGLAVRFGLPIDFSFGLRSLFRAGYQGVDLFFVLSGFVIAWPYVVDRQTRLDRYQVADFYQRRYLRIAPIYYVTLAVALALMSRVSCATPSSPGALRRISSSPRTSCPTGWPRYAACTGRCRRRFTSTLSFRCCSGFSTSMTRCALLAG